MHSQDMLCIQQENTMRKLYGMNNFLFSSISIGSFYLHPSFTGSVHDIIQNMSGPGEPES
jgi:hypothetical protein